jgi:hypothetical protein
VLFDDPTLGSGQSYDEDDIADESVFDDDDEPANAYNLSKWPTDVKRGGLGWRSD